MRLEHIHKAGWLVGLVLLQVLVLNHVHLFGYATPFLYIYLLLKFESDVPRNVLMLWGFILGLAVDVFSDTPGMNASASVLLAFLRPLLVRLFVARDITDAIVPGMRSMGPSSFTKYVVAGVCLHHAWLFVIEYFTFAHLSVLLLRIFSSSLLTVGCLLAVEGFRGRKK